MFADVLTHVASHDFSTALVQKSQQALSLGETLAIGVTLLTNTLQLKSTPLPLEEAVNQHGSPCSPSVAPEWICKVLRAPRNGCCISYEVDLTDLLPFD